MQRRDISNEVIVALAAIGMLALALTFGVVLTLSRTANVILPSPTLIAAGPTGITVSPAAQTATAQALIRGTQAVTRQATQAATQAVAQVATTRPTTQAATSQPPTATNTSTAKPTQTPATQPATSTSTVTSTSTATTKPSATSTVTLTSSQAVPTQPATAQAAAQVATQSLATQAATSTQVPTVVLSTVSETVAPTSTNTFTATSTVTPVPPTKTLTPTRTPSPILLTATQLPTSMPTNTRVPSSTLTLTPLPTSTPTNTSTIMPPTETATDTPTVTPTDTPTDTPLASETSAETPTPSMTPPADIGIIGPSGTEMFVSVTPGPETGFTTDESATPCVPRSGWVVYIVQQGDTLFSISRQVGLTVSELQAANCLPDPSTIYSGQVIFIPPGKTVNPSGPTSSVNVALCPNPDVRITSPAFGATVSGIFPVTGTARGANFSSYKLEFLIDGNHDWVNFGQFSTPVTNGLLGKLDPNPSRLPSGGYSLRLTVTTTSGSNPAPCVIKVIFVR